MPTFNTLFVGKVVVDRIQATSTNDEAIALLTKTKPAEGTVIAADFQTAGRGQIGSSWHASPGRNLLLSVIFYPHWLPARRGFLLSLAAGLAVADTLRSLSIDAVRVKWPNDIYLGARKVAGLLLQNSLSGQRIQWSVVGIGLNVNEAAFPAGLPNPISLQQHLGREIDRDSLRGALFTHLESRYLQLRSQPDRMLSDYHALLYRRGELTEFRRTATGERFAATIRGVSSGGRLLVVHPGGREEAFDLKALELIAGDR